MGMATAGPSPAKRGGSAEIRSSWKTSSLMTGAAVENASPISVRSRGSTRPRWASPSIPTAISTPSASLPSTGIATAARAEPEISLARSAMRSSASARSLPDIRLCVISAFALSQRSRSRESSYSRALSMATPAATASVDRTASSSSSKASPPRFSVRYRLPKTWSRTRIGTPRKLFIGG